MHKNTQLHRLCVDSEEDCLGQAKQYLSPRHPPSSPDAPARHTVLGKKGGKERFEERNR